MNIFKTIADDINNILCKIWSIDCNFTVEIPKQSQHGDIATNAAMVLVKQLNKNPLEIAKDIVDQLQNMPYIKQIEVVKPGFINIFLKNEILYDFLLDKNPYASLQNIGNGRKVNIEFVSANPTGPLHLGNGRSAIYGDVLCRLLKVCGYEVTAEYYINDAGKQIDLLIESVQIRIQQQLGQDVQLEKQHYQGEYINDIAAKYLKSSNVDIKKFAIEEMMNSIKQVLHTLKVHHDLFTSEQALIDRGMVEESLAILQTQNLLYEGILEQPKGHLEDWEPRQQLLFKSTDFGDDVDRPLVKSDGSYAYFASDIALHLDKINRGYDELFLLLGADHGGYVKRMEATVKCLSHDSVEMHVLINQLVNVYDNGQIVRMSKRTGKLITINDIIDEIGVDVFRFAMLMYTNDSVIDIDCEKLKIQSKDNPIFYIQYCHTRVCSLLRRSYTHDIFTPDEISIDKINDKIEYSLKTKDVDYTLLSSDLDLEIIKKLLAFIKILEIAAVKHEPHKITYYLYELSTLFHTLWNKDDLRFISDDKRRSRARIACAYHVAKTIGFGMDILGIEPMITM